MRLLCSLPLQAALPKPRHDRILSNMTFFWRMDPELERFARLGEVILVLLAVAAYVYFKARYSH